MKTILVTGAGGFIGRRLVQSLRARGDRVIAALRAQRSTASSHAKGEEYALDLSDAESVRRLASVIGAVDATVHLAARIPRGPGGGGADDPLAVHHADVAAIENLFDAFGTSLGHVTYASSIDVYGNVPNSPYRETQPLTPATAYGASKAAGEEVVRRRAPPSAILRLSQVYGFGEPVVKVIPRFIERIQRGQPLPIAGGGADRRRYLALADAVRAFQMAIDARPVGPFNIAGEEIVSIRELVRTFEQALGRPLAVEDVGGAPTGDRYVALDHARETFGFRPTVSLVDGLREYLTSTGGLTSSDRG